jgi:hypothetical protein
MANRNILFFLLFFKAGKIKYCGGPWNGALFGRLERRHETK